MSTNSSYLHSELTKRILKCFFKVYNTLGHGFLEKVYENALMIELLNSGIFCEQQKMLKVKYKGEEIDTYSADILVEHKVILELKAVEGICPEHEAQLVNYLRATDLEFGLLLNFGKPPQHRRRVLTNDFKPKNS